MRNLIFSILTLLLSMPVNGQVKLDKVVLSDGTILACHIDNLSDKQMIIRSRQKRKWRSQTLNLGEIQSFDKSVFRVRDIRREFGTSSVIAQRSEAKNIRDVLVHGMILQSDHVLSLTLGYEGIFPVHDHIGLTARLSGGITYESGSDPVLIAQIGALAGKTKHFGELGMAYYEPSGYKPIFIPSVGYRYLGFKGFTIKVFGKLNIYTSDSEIEMWGQYEPAAGIQLGYRHGFVRKQRD
jgi:hypothetical protein